MVVVSKPKMLTMALDQNLNPQNDTKPEDGPASIIEEEIEGLIKVYETGYVERSLNVVPSVSPLLGQDLDVNARDVFIDKVNNIWARTYVPKCNNNQECNKYKFPLVIYFHGGGFCVGSTAWKCYHDFLGNLSSQARCIIVSVNYRLAPEDRLPAAYEDGMKALMWVKQQAMSQSSEFWAKYCDFSSIFLAGDSAGANLAYNVTLKYGIPHIITPLIIKGIILIHPFFGSEFRSNSELKVQPRKSVLSLEASDTYWRLALPLGADRDHPWCNPLGECTRKLENMRVMVCVAENDILRDRNLELCSKLANKNLCNKIEHVISLGMGHAFHILDESKLSQICKKEMFNRIMEFISE